mgnify:CR=1 FL=1
MLSNLVWLFPAYRELYEENVILQQRLQATLQALEQRPSTDAGDLINEFQDKILQDLPFPDGKIPDTVWLTPGENDR